MSSSLDSLSHTNSTSDFKANFIAIEGPIGVGKTSLTKRLTETFQFQTLLEEPQDNPFLERFYQQPDKYALPTQLYFLFQRISQLEHMSQGDLFSPKIISDFLIDKDAIFAETNLQPDENALYQKVFSSLTIKVPLPDLIIYLQAPTSVLNERVKKRGIAYEQQIDSVYLEKLNDAYMRYFHEYSASPILIVNAAEIDFINDQRQYDELVKAILNAHTGRNFYNPLSPHI